MVFEKKIEKSVPKWETWVVDERFLLGLEESRSLALLGMTQLASRDNLGRRDTVVISVRSMGLRAGVVVATGRNGWAFRALGEFSTELGEEGLEGGFVDGFAI